MADGRRERTVHVLTNSRRQECTTCSYREFLKYDLGLSPWRAADPLVFGDLWHRLMAAVYRIHAWWETAPFGPDEPELSWEEVKQTVLGSITHEIVPVYSGSDFTQKLIDDTFDLLPVVPEAGVVNAWFQEKMALTKPGRDGESMPIHNRDDLVEMATLATSMLDGYLQQWWEHDRRAWVVLAVEHRMSSPIVGPKGHNSWKWLYQGDGDLIVQLRESGVVLVVDHKTCSGEPAAEFPEYAVSPQLDGYAWLWSKQHPNMVPEGVLYRGSRKKVPSVPKRNKCPGKKADGVVGESHEGCTVCLGTENGPLSEAACDTTPGIYEEAMRQSIFEGFTVTGKHQIRLAELRQKWPKAWFDEYTRWLKRERPFARFERETWNITQEKSRKMAAGEWAHTRADNPKTCAMYGRPCSHMAICERNADNSLELWKQDGMLHELFKQEKQVL